MISPTAPGGYPQGGYYQQHPPQQGQWPPPSQNPYGQPPPGQYGAPQPHPPQSYGHSPAPPPQGSPYGGGGGGGYAPPQVPPTPPSLGYGPPQMIQWDGAADAQALRSAMKGFGTDENTLIRVLATKDPLQVEVLRTTFDRTFGRKLIDDIKKETSRYFERGLVQLARGPLLADAHNIYEALTGVGTKEVVMNDVLLSRSNADLRAIKGAYQHAFRRSLEDDVKHNLSMKTERHFLMVLAANRAEDAAPVIPQQVEDDVLNIYKATEGKVGTDELLVCSILSARNDNQIRAISHTYRRKFSRELSAVIKSEFSGHMEDALLHQLRHAEDKYMHAAKLLEDTMAGPGTKDFLLVNRIVQFHWSRNDMANIKGAYQQRYRRTLASRVRGEVSGDYERLMVACIGE
ncbi:Annexin A7 [Escovopsis weberi]|uniref:Annexin n=1 Tax=Escovopsis weberi TaxID=150374 RepID=A0A0M8MZF1_ESCWE|nr:Annexin A7 [Escovopsis weberi]